MSCDRFRLRSRACLLPTASCLLPPAYFLLLTAAPLLAALPAPAQTPVWDGLPYGESPWICGVNGDGGEPNMEDMGTPGWIVFTEAVGRDPSNPEGRDYTGWADRGFGVIAVLRHGAGNDGALPYEKHEDDFVRRCAAFAAASRGCPAWVIGNETNLPAEWPRYEGNAEPVAPERYARCFRKCREAIQKAPGHEKDAVLVQAVAPWAAGEGRGFVPYFEEVLRHLGGAFDGVALHAYTHGADPNAPLSGEKRNGVLWHLRVYQHMIEAVPAPLRAKTRFYVTEAAPTDPPEWPDINRGWVKNACIEINRWNLDPRNPKIRALCLSRWRPSDARHFGAKPNVVQDWREAMRMKFHWTSSRPRRADPSAAASEPEKPKAAYVTPRAAPAAAGVPEQAWIDGEDRFLEYAEDLRRRGRSADARDVWAWLSGNASSPELREQAKARAAEIERRERTGE